ncbi:MAG: isocitrate lyase/phosphoenolpyruvate mutase family protein [Sorangiineae bacterium]|nr:isocitrate lyase/phosphoenolpyruvate mutase family protein [Polyangiaceae bacterium]MEB2324043.1 isocitrate lyase/phosphoenolpyruvate mutase family protein [Sorangiineae bacterium]
MTSSNQLEQAGRFRQMHRGAAPLLLANAWDAGSARLIERLGLPAVATTSGGVAWALGYRDGERAPLDEVLGVTARIVRAVAVPVTADLETGYGESLGELAETIRRAIEAGVVGVNIEDSRPGHGARRSAEEAAERVAAAREASEDAGVPIVINARVDEWMTESDAPEAERLERATARARAYLEAGADCIFPIGLSAPSTLRALVRSLAAPVNVIGGPSSPTLAELGALGVARVSLGTRLSALALGAVDGALRAVLETGRFDALRSEFGYPDAERLFD